MKLYEIKEEYLRLLDMDLDEETMKDTLESLDFDLEEKADNIACVIKSLEAEEEAIKKEVENLLIRANIKAKKAENLKTYLYSTMKQLSKNKIESSRNCLTIKKNPASVILEDNFCDGKYMVTKTTCTPDKTAIKKALQDGEIIEGARLEQKERLEVK